jgi:hypothetical protein
VAHAEQRAATLTPDGALERSLTPGVVAGSPLLRVLSPNGPLRDSPLHPSRSGGLVLPSQEREAERRPRHAEDNYRYLECALANNHRQQASDKERGKGRHGENEWQQGAMLLAQFDAADAEREHYEHDCRRCPDTCDHV